VIKTRADARIDFLLGFILVNMPSRHQWQFLEIDGLLFFDFGSMLSNIVVCGWVIGLN
jgi:hypothetical protein